MKLKVARTELYADPNPSIAHWSVDGGQELDIPNDIPLYMAKRIVELDGGDLVEDRETKVIEVESKDKPKRGRGRPRKEA
jgi:hypothetical protein